MFRLFLPCCKDDLNPVSLAQMEQSSSGSSRWNLGFSAWWLPCIKVFQAHCKASSPSESPLAGTGA